MKWVPLGSRELPLQEKLKETLDVNIVRKVSDEALSNLIISPFVTCEVFEALCARNCHALSCWVSSSFLRCVYLGRAVGRGGYGKHRAIWCLYEGEAQIRQIPSVKPTRQENDYAVKTRPCKTQVPSPPVFLFVCLAFVFSVFLRAVLEELQLLDFFSYL